MKTIGEYADGARLLVVAVLVAILMFAAGSVFGHFVWGHP